MFRTRSRTLDMDYPSFHEPEKIVVNIDMLVPPAKQGEQEALEKGPHIKPLPDFDPLPEEMQGPVLLKTSDNISTDDIIPAGAEILPYRSNIPAISRFVFRQLDEGYAQRALKHQDGGHFIVGGENYGQGSSREHAALAPRYLGVKAVIAKSFARIHWQNLVNFGILPLTFEDPRDYGSLEQGDVLVFERLRDAIKSGKAVKVKNKTKNKSLACEHQMSERQIEMVLQGSLLTVIKYKH